MSARRPRRSPARGGFTLLEVVIALAVLAISLMVLVEAQGSAVVQTLEARRMLTASYLAQEKMTEALLKLESEGFSTDDVEEEGDFEQFAEDLGVEDEVEFGDSFDDYHWAYTIRKVDVQLGDMSGAADQLEGAGFGPSQDQQDQADANGQGGRDLGDMGIQPDMISDMLAPYIREVRVVVWWGEDPPADKACEDCVELTTHVANPSGEVVPGSGGDPGAGG